MLVPLDPHGAAEGERDDGASVDPQAPTVETQAPQAAPPMPSPLSFGPLPAMSDWSFSLGSLGDLGSWEEFEVPPVVGGATGSSRGGWRGPSPAMRGSAPSGPVRGGGSASLRRIPLARAGGAAGASATRPSPVRATERDGWEEFLDPLPSYGRTTGGDPTPVPAYGRTTGGDPTPFRGPLLTPLPPAGGRGRGGSAAPPALSEDSEFVSKCPDPPYHLSSSRMRSVQECV